MRFFREMKSRNVFKVGLVYLVVGWALIQVGDLVAPQMNLPEWTPRMITFVVMLGFPVALVMAWALELTPEGVKKAGGSNAPIYIFAVIMAGISMAWFFDTSVETTVQTTRMTGQAEPATATLNNPGLPSIAVIPFANMSMDVANEPFTIGIHDDLLTQLSKISSLKTISRTSVLRYRDSDLPIPDIAAELGVSSVLEGGVQRVGDNVRINVQLINAATDEHLWAETYDRELSAANIFAIQSEIARSIADALEATLTETDQQRMESVPTQSLEALEAYFTGKALADRRGTEPLEAAIRQFEHAISLDPGFALAYAGLGYAWLLLPEYSLEADPELTRVNSQAAIEKALELDPEGSEGLAFMGWSRMVHEHDWPMAEQLLRQALDIKANNSDAMHWLSHVLSFQGRHEEALTTARKALEVDPYSPLMNMNLAYIFMDDRQYEEAAKYRKISEDLNLNPTVLWRNTFVSYLRSGEFASATEAAVKWASAIGRDPGKARRMGEILEQASRTGEKAQFPPGLLSDLGISTHHLAQVYAAGNDAENTLAELRIALDERSGSRSVLSMKINPLYDFIRNEPRFIQLMKEANLTL
jgi:TolB-like protein/Flp pilus assembly protein TadD